MAERKLLFLAADGYPEEAAGTDTATFGGLTLGGAIAMGGNKVTGMGDGTAPQDAVTKTQLDAVSGGLDYKESVRVKTDASLAAWTPAGAGVGKTLTSPNDNVSNNDFDGITMLVGERILVTTVGVTDVTPNLSNGIYTMTTLADGAGQNAVLTRATDQDEDAEFTAGNCTFVAEGTLHKDQTWCVVTNDPITVDTTAVQFSQISATAALNFNAGLTQTANNVDVELDTAAAAQTAGNGGGSSGLEFDIAGVAGKLRAAVNATAGLERTASGIGVLLNGTTLGLSGSGIAVLGLPSLFTINAVAVSANVTAANLTELTGGGPTVLHSHAGADEAQRIETVYTSDGTGHTIGDPVFVSANNVTSSCNANNVNTRKFIGLAKATVGAAASVDIIGAGVVTGLTVGGAPSAGDIVYLAVGGGLTVTRPVASGDHSLVVGKMKNATDVDSSKAQYLGKAA